MEFLVGALAATLIISLVALFAQHRLHRRSLVIAMAQETRALDRAHAAELRASQQIDAMLERIATQPRLELSTGTKLPVVDPDTPKYISDEPYMDEAWNNYRGVTDEDAPE